MMETSHPMWRRKMAFKVRMGEDTHIKALLLYF
jgi:hypothetical protein